jgi:hypothetical protein
VGQTCLICSAGSFLATSGIGFKSCNTYSLSFDCERGEIAGVCGYSGQVVKRQTNALLYSPVHEGGEGKQRILGVILAYACMHAIMTVADRSVILAYQA